MPDNDNSDAYSTNAVTGQKVKIADYFVFETESPEWVWVLQNMINKVKDEAASDDVLMVPPHTYMFRKTRFPADVIAKVIRTTPEKVLAAKTIKLKPFEQPKDLPAPTVSYFGVA